MLFFFILCSFLSCGKGQEDSWEKVSAQVKQLSLSYRLNDDKSCLDSAYSILLAHQDSSSVYKLYKLSFECELGAYQNAYKTLEDIHTDKFVNFGPQYKSTLLLRLKALIALKDNDVEKSREYIFTIIQDNEEYLDKHKEEFDAFMKNATGENALVQPLGLFLGRYICFYAYYHGENAAFRRLDDFQERFPMSEKFIFWLREDVKRFKIDVGILV